MTKKLNSYNKILKTHKIGGQLAKKKQPGEEPPEKKQPREEPPEKKQPKEEPPEKKQPKEEPPEKKGPARANLGPELCRFTKISTKSSRTDILILHSSPHPPHSMSSAYP